ncbi:hypothetical protein DOY81_000168 [Sarcophaga bullata]|nr:hypothetical protein DOY81_000168 [Sarcophaga bullata]
MIMIPTLVRRERQTEHKSTTKFNILAKLLKEQQQQQEPQI